MTLLPSCIIQYPFNQLGGQQSTGNTLSNKFTIKGILLNVGALGHAPNHRHRLQSHSNIILKAKKTEVCTRQRRKLWLFKYALCLCRYIYDQLRAQNRPLYFIICR